MLDDDNLNQRALTGIDALLSNLLKGRITTEATATSREWDGLLRRHVFLQDSVAWHEFGQVKVGVSAEGRVLHFRDDSRFEAAVFRKLSEAEVLEICATTGMIGRRIDKVEITSAADGMLAATVLQRHHRHPPRIEFLINCERRQVAAMQVAGSA